MVTIETKLRRLLPNGTGRGEDGSDLRGCPAWPPDVFAVVSTLARDLGCYAEERYSHAGVARYLFTETRRQTLKDVGKNWRDHEEVPEQAEAFWSEILTSQDLEVERWMAVPENLSDAIMALLVIADEAGEGIGWVYDKSFRFADFVHQQNKRLLAQEAVDLQLPESLCLLVPCSEACVQPKTLSPLAGATIRSFSHHLALLPPSGRVATSWLYGPVAYQKRADGITLVRPPEEAFNLLLVPFPYRIRGTAFQPAHQGTKDHPFASFMDIDVESWLRGVSIGDLVRFLLTLIGQAEKECGSLHGIILPEIALDQIRAQGIADHLARHAPRLKLFITGVATPATKDTLATNRVYAALFQEGKIFTHWEQSKHHRWALDRDQITRYQLGHTLSPARRWWENTSIGGRHCAFYTFRFGASLAVLVCEDLARIDPVQTVIRAVGPNLVVALLMDGAQYTWRWPGRYATILADDPGSSVLTLTCLGMLRRSVRPGEKTPRQIGLWKEAGGETQELHLDAGQHALLVTLSSCWQENWTLDGRSDGRTTIQLSLSGVRGIAADEPFREITV